MTTLPTASEIRLICEHLGITRNRSSSAETQRAHVKKNPPEAPATAIAPVEQLVSK